MEDVKQRFTGTWELVEWIAKSANGRLYHPCGADAVGRIFYDDQGHMAVQIMKNNRPHFASEDPLQALPNEIIAAYDGCIAYCGDYEIDLAANQVIHQVKISSFPNWAGQKQERNFEFTEDQLILTTPPVGSIRHTLIWKKLN